MLLGLNPIHVVILFLPSSLVSTEATLHAAWCLFRRQTPSWPSWLHHIILFQNVRRPLDSSPPNLCFYCFLILWWCMGLKLKDITRDCTDLPYLEITRLLFDHEESTANALHPPTLPSMDISGISGMAPSSSRAASAMLIWAIGLFPGGQAVGKTPNKQEQVSDWPCRIIEPICKTQQKRA